MKRSTSSAFAGLLMAALLLCACPALAQDPDVRNGNTNAGRQNAAAYVAKNLASAIFVSGREKDEVVLVDLGAPVLGFITADVDHDKKTVTVTHTPYGSATAKCIYRDGLGCTLVTGMTEEDLRAQPVPKLPAPPEGLEQIAWPVGDAVTETDLPEEVDADALAMALNNAFAEPDPDRPTRRTRAALVVYRGNIIAERYAEGFHKYMPLLSHSMTKSVTSALVGILVGQGKLDIHATGVLPVWTSDGDPRRDITLDDLLRMSSGLEWNEVYLDLTSDVVQMLYGERDAALFASARPLADPIDSKWYYSSGTTNIVCRIIRDTFDGQLEDYFAFPRRALLHPIGMYHAFMEPCPSGTFVGSSFMYCTPRDWARFALLYMNDGVWQGERILPEGWVKYSTTPSPTAKRGQYGAFIWLNAGAADDPTKREMPDVPVDAFSFNGFDGQFVVTVPSRDLIVVRMGHTRDRSAFRINDFVRDVLAAIEPAAVASE